MSRKPTVVKPQKAVHPSTAEAMERLKAILRQDKENKKRLDEKEKSLERKKVIEERLDRKSMMSEPEFGIIADENPPGTEQYPVSQVDSKHVKNENRKESPDDK